MARSRLSRQLQEKSLHTIIVSIGGSILVILLLIFFGIPALTRLGGLLQGGKEEEIVASETASYIAPPSLDPLYTATNSAEITVRGTSMKGYVVRLYNNDTFIDEVEAKDDGTFIFRDVRLKEGDNALKVRAKDTKKNKQSNDSPTSHVLYSDKEPSLSIDYPTDGSSFKDNRTITVRGKTDTDADVTVNGFRAIMDSNGGYSYNLQLHDGSNDITVVTTSSAGNTKSQTIRINYN